MLGYIKFTEFKDAGMCK